MCLDCLMVYGLCCVPYFLCVLLLVAVGYFAIYRLISLNGSVYCVLG